MRFHHGGTEVAEFGIFLVKNYFLCALSDSAVNFRFDRYGRIMTVKFTQP